MTKEIRKEKDWFGDEKEVIYEDGKKTGEVRNEKTSILGTPVKREYNNKGERVSETRHEHGFLHTPVERTYDNDGKRISETRHERTHLGSPVDRTYSNGKLIAETRAEKTFLGESVKRVYPKTARPNQPADTPVRSYSSGSYDYSPSGSKSDFHSSGKTWSALLWGVVICLILLYLSHNVHFYSESPASWPETNTTVSNVGKQVFLDEFSNATLGKAYGISWTNAIGNHGALFSAANASRIEYPGKISREGTIEFWINVDSGYGYADYIFERNLENATIFSTDALGGDVTWPGTTKFTVSRNGNVSLFVAERKYNSPPTVPIEAHQTRFRFGEWHAVGFSVGSLGQFIMVDGKLVAAARSRTQQMGSAGTHQVPADLPTIGETASHFWPYHRYEGGFEGIVARFRSSSRQRDWDLALGVRNGP